MEKLIIEITVGYMLKILKNGKDVTKFKNEFAAIRHGNFDDFIDLVKGEKPVMVVSQDGIISDQHKVSQKTHFDFAALILAGPSLKKFLKECDNEYGTQLDTDISDDIYAKLALFEVGLRMHANNNNLLQPKENLEKVITKLCNFKGISKIELDILQQGRKFLNDIKHHNDPKYKRKFKTWSDGIKAFEKSYDVIKINKFTII